MTSTLVTVVTVKDAWTAANLKKRREKKVMRESFFHWLSDSVVRTVIQTALSKKVWKQSLWTFFSSLFSQLHIYHALCSVKLRDKPEIPEWFSHRGTFCDVRRSYNSSKQQLSSAIYKHTSSGNNTFITERREKSWGREGLCNTAD